MNRNASLILLVAMAFVAVDVSIAQFSKSRFTPAMARDKGILIEFEASEDSLVAWHMPVADVIRAAEGGVKSSGWGINDGSEYMVAISISMTVDTLGQHVYRLEANGGKAASSTELLGAMRDRPTLERKYVLNGTDTRLVMDGIRNLAATASRELFAALGRDDSDFLNEQTGHSADIDQH